MFQCYLPPGGAGSVLFCSSSPGTPGPGHINSEEMAVPFRKVTGLLGHWCHNSKRGCRYPSKGVASAPSRISSQGPTQSAPPGWGAGGFDLSQSPSLGGGTGQSCLSHRLLPKPHETV